MKIYLSDKIRNIEDRRYLVNSYEHTKITHDYQTIDLQLDSDYSIEFSFGMDEAVVRFRFPSIDDYKKILAIPTLSMMIISGDYIYHIEFRNRVILGNVIKGNIPLELVRHFMVSDKLLISFKLGYDNFKERE